jgi:hypothetical protein
VDRIDGTARSGRMLAAAALVLALVAVGLAAWQLVGGPDTCQQQAWDVEPDANDLPDGWALSASQYDLSRKTMSFVGALPADEFSGQAAIITTITCFPEGAVEAVTRSREAAEDAEQSVVARDDLGDQAFSAVDPSGATFMQLRSGNVVVYLAGTPDTASTDVERLASAFDLALGGDGGEIAPPEPVPSDVGLGSPDPGASQPGVQAVPELAALLPATVGDHQIEITSLTGADFLGEDPGSRAVLAALRDAGLDASDLKVAEGYDSLAETDLQLLAVTIDGLPVGRTRDIVLDVWLAASGPGVTTDTVTLDGEEWMRIDYGDDSRKDYVLLKDDVVIDVTTSDRELAEQVAAALP